MVTLQENVFQVRPNIVRKGYGLKEMSELGRAQLNKSSLCLLKVNGSFFCSVECNAIRFPP